VTIGFTEFSARYTTGTESLTKVFELKIDEKKDIPYDYYLIMPEIEGFSTQDEFRTISSYNYIKLNGKTSVSFSTTQNVDFLDLQAFVSPSITELSLTGQPAPPEQPKTNIWLVFGIIILFLIVLGVIVYFVMREWYKKKYENHLFKDKNDLYNMINYLNNAKRKGLSNEQISNNLKKAGWSGEKISYVLKKYAGKRTGLI
jgi:hypothetical protein